jgi:hypothetical protein
MIRISWLTVFLTCGISILNYPAFAHKMIMLSKQDIQELLKNICGQNNIIEKANISGENRFGCEVKEANKQISLPISNTDFLAVEGVIYGSFSKPGIQEA